MAENQLNRQLAAGVRAAQQGNHERARELLEGVLRQDQNNEQAWIWMASVVESDRKCRLSLERVLKINPNNKPAQDALNTMVGVLGGGESSSIDYLAISDAARTPVPGRSSGSGGDGTSARPQSGGGRNWIPLMAGIVVVLGLLFAGSLFLPQFFQAEPTELPTEVVEATVEVEITEEAVDPLFTPSTSTPIPTATFDFSSTRVAVTSSFPTIAPSTPTVPPTATDLPTEAPTLPPPSDYNFLMLGVQGSATISLYRIDGAGDNLQPLISNISDFDYNPATGLLVYTRHIFVEVPTLVPSPTNTPLPLSPTPAPTDIDGSQDSGGGGGFALPISNAVQDELQIQMFVATLDNPDDASEITGSSMSSAFSPSISPDGQFIAFASPADGDPEIYVYEVSTGLSTQITRNQNTEDIDPDWSPDGTRLIFSSDRNRPINNDIFVIDPFAEDPESTVVEITNSQGRSIQPQWSPVADEFVYLNEREGATTLRYATLNGIIVRDLSLQSSWTYTPPSWTPDGAYVLYSSAAPDARILEFRLYSPLTRSEETLPVINLNILQIVPR